MPAAALLVLCPGVVGLGPAMLDSDALFPNSTPTVSEPVRILPGSIPYDEADHLDSPWHPEEVNPAPCLFAG